MRFVLDDAENKNVALTLRPAQSNPGTPQLVEITLTDVDRDQQVVSYIRLRHLIAMLEAVEKVR